jgi:hypothetical protein
MSLLGRLLNAVFQPELGGMSLNLAEPFWELSGETNFPSLFAALPILLPAGCVLYLEGGYPEDELLEFLQTNNAEDTVRIASGTVWPEPKVFRLPATSTVLDRLSKLSQACAVPEVAAHFHVYCGQAVLLEWHGVFTPPALIPGKLPTENIRRFAEGLGLDCRQGETVTLPTPPRAP